MARIASLGAGIEAAAIHGNKTQPQRERALAGFRDGQARVLVATDVAARGIDVDGVSHVFNFDLPNVPEDYVHRIGRTARAGATGIAIAFCSDEERPYLRDIEKLTRRPVAVKPSLALTSRPAADAAERPPMARLPHGSDAKPRPAQSKRPQPVAGMRNHRNRANPRSATASLPAFLRHRPAASGARRPDRP